MRKQITDWYFSGFLFGTISGIAIDLMALILLLLGIVPTTPWSDMTHLLFKYPASAHILAKFYGLLTAISAAGITGSFTALLIKLTGKDYIYFKCVSFGLGNQMFTFLVLYPLLGYTTIQHVPQVPLISTALFSIYGLMNGFLFKRYAGFAAEPYR
jgi:hypothetical protein